MAMLATTRMLMIQNMRWLRETDAFWRRMLLTGEWRKESIGIASQSEWVTVQPDGDHSSCADWKSAS
ncbi:MAG: hypothetical protein ACK4WK_06905, partial [Anaerolineae bacterium]